MNYYKYIIIFLTISSSYFLSLNATNPAPYNFNVYMTGNIGSASNPYANDFQGISGSGGNSYFTGYSINANGPAYSYSAYAGGSFTATSGSTSNGGIEAGGTINLNASTINGNINSGGNLTGGTGNIYGNATLAGTNSSSQTISGTLTQNHTYSPSLSLSAVTNYFQGASTFWASLAPTATVTNVYGQLQVSNLQAGRNVVNITLAQLSAAYGIALNGPANSYVIFNITDATATNQTVKDVTFSLSGGINSSDIIYNLPNATQLTLNGGDYLNVLAVNADITFSSGALAGSLIGKDLLGSGQVNSGSFTGFQQDQSNFAVSTPEPATYLILASFVAIMFLIRYRNKVKVE